MATLQNMIDDLNDRLNDSGNSQVPEATKIRYVNHGIRATWPRLYRTARDSTLAYVADTYEYAIPVAVGSNGKILRIEIEKNTVTPARYVDLVDFDVVPGLTDPILKLHNIQGVVVGDNIRITAAKQLTELVALANTYDGPAGTEELPVLYAMGIALSRRLDDRLDHRRYASLQAPNAPQVGDMMDASQFWFAQFELLLERFAMPLPAPGT